MEKMNTTFLNYSKSDYSQPDKTVIDETEAASVFPLFPQVEFLNHGYDHNNYMKSSFDNQAKEQFSTNSNKSAFKPKINNSHPFLNDKELPQLSADRLEDNEPEEETMARIYDMDGKPQLPEGLLWNLLESLPVNISIWEDGKVLYANDAFYNTFSAKKTSIKNLNDFVKHGNYVTIHPDDFSTNRRDTEQVKDEVNKGIVFHREMRMKSHADNDYKWYNTYVVKGKDPGSRITIEIDEDINDKKNANEKLKEALKEKEILLKEVHHRVKNNFHVISSLLRIQSSKSANNEVRAALNESFSRVNLMAMMHESLYRSSDLANVNFGEQAKTICGKLAQMYKDNLRKVNFTYDLDNVSLGVDHAIPCSLILNELVSNSFKYAFGKNLFPELTIQLKLRNNIVTLGVRDNGPGYPPGFEDNSSGSIGMMIVKTLVSQMQGAVEFRNTGGAEAVIKFTLD